MHFTTGSLQLLTYIKVMFLLIYTTGFIKIVSIICAKKPICTLISQLLKVASKPCKRGTKLSKQVKGKKNTDIPFNFLYLFAGR